MAKNMDTKNKSTDCSYENRNGENKGAQNGTNKASNKASDKASNKASDKASGSENCE